MTPQCSNVYTIHVKKDLVTHMHMACVSPLISTWKKAMHIGYFATWPGLDEHLVQKHQEKSIATAKGHLDLTRKHIRSAEINLTNNIDQAIGNHYNELGEK
eukprot:2019598-Ditylum_brightwellii.AAC.1